ncbi:uncharacterized protein LOC125058905 [Pieris napi]|uniref:uncharacterized protein LOC125058905 n=1 Tax=Pieris napi TaxID=78633 RepID=UPI001FB9094A|nr:uncharacterized protein LOC125058905 [Pieris napi]
MSSWKKRKRCGGVKRKISNEYKLIIRSNQSVSSCDKTTKLQTVPIDAVQHHSSSLKRSIDDASLGCSSFCNEYVHPAQLKCQRKCSYCRRNSIENVGQVREFQQGLENHNMYVSSKHGETQDIEQGSVQRELNFTVEGSVQREFNFTEEGSVEQEFNFTGEGSVQREFNFTEDASLSTYPLSSSHSSDEEEESEYIKNSNFKNDIRIWAIEKNISQAAFKDLILILNKRFVNILPSDPRTILQTPTQICLKSFDGGEYWHNGIIIPLTKILHNLEFVPENVYLNVNLDGLPIFKSSKFEFWPILANMHEIDNVPFIIGIYYGKGKPKNLNLFLEDFVNESITVLEQ